MSTTQAASYPLPLPQELLTSNGRWISGANGRTYIFHGVNMVNKLPPYTLSATGFDTRSAQLLADHGINVVRVGVIYSAVEPAPGVYDDNYLNDIRATVDMLAAYGIMSLIDFHQDGWGPSFLGEGFPDWATLTGGHGIRPIENFPRLYKNPAVATAFDSFWNHAVKGPGDVPLQDRYAAAWARAVSVLSGAADPNCILGWELMNEPFPGSAWSDYTKPPFSNPTTDQALTDFTQRVVNAIRTVDQQRMIWYEPWVVFDAGIPTFIGPITDPGSVRRIGFAFHNYEKGPLYELVWDEALKHSKSSGDALLVTEFGATTEPWVIETQMDSADKAMMPVIYWAYSNRTPYQIEAFGKLVSSTEQALVYDPALPLVPDNLKEHKLAALCRPYPMSVGGVPQQWAYKRDTKTFQLTYAVKPAGDTVIFVPKRHYPRGINVVPGSFHWSFDPSNPQLLVIRGNPGVTEVTVQFTPA